MEKKQDEYIEKFENYSISFKLNKVLFQGKSNFHRVDIIDAKEHGKMLFLDNFTNSAQGDEFIYHEMIVHPAMITHPNPKKVLVIGGGEGATLREVLKHDTVEQAVMVDIDEKLVELCKEYLPEWSNGSFENPKTKLIIQDARKFLEETIEQFDVIVIDLSDPVDAGPAFKLFTQEFYQLVFNRLTSEGVVAVQAENLRQKGVWVHAHMYNTLKTVFPLVFSYAFFQDSFHEPGGFILCSKKYHPVTEETINRIQTRNLELRYFSEKVQKGLLLLPKFVFESYKKFPEIITDKKPLIVNKKIF
ncbi:polyamine aminopropyltransferase [Candidatus Micrarchaeota archaeon]|nr:polyamine aminopropyltransferase [Candidatus Micrarchaeota archaeon]